MISMDFFGGGGLVGGPWRTPRSRKLFENLQEMSEDNCKNALFYPIFQSLKTTLIFPEFERKIQIPGKILVKIQ